MRENTHRPSAMTRREARLAAAPTRVSRTSDAATARDGRPKQRWVARTRRLVLGSGIICAALVVVTSVPASAVGPTMTAITVTAPDSRPSLPSQNFTASAGRALEVTRDGFAATSAEELAALTTAQAASAAAAALDSTVRWPFLVGVPISDDFGSRNAPCSGCSTNHKGLDMTPGVNTPIGIVADGLVRETGESDSGFGVYAIIDHMVDGELVSSLYAHMQFGSLQVAVGDPVTAGQVVGDVGNSGQSTGPHLHLEILQDGTTQIDPFAWLSAQVTP